MTQANITIKCPECGAMLNIEEGRRQCFCSYCGTKIMIPDSSEQIEQGAVENSAYIDAEREVYNDNRNISSTDSDLDPKEKNLLKRGFLAVETGQFYNGYEFFEQVLNMHAECGQAYFGKALCGLHSKNIEELALRFWEYIDKINRSEMVQWDTVSTIREMDKENGVLSEISDQELKMLLKGLEDAGKTRKWSRVKFLDELMGYMDQELIETALQCEDYVLALKFADDEVRANHARLKECVKQGYYERIAKEEGELLEAKEAMNTEIRNRYNIALKESEKLQRNYKYEKYKAENAAEEEYQHALEEYEHEYQMRLAAHEEQYRIAVENWEREKEEYPGRCDEVRKRRNELILAIHNKQEESDSITGAFNIVKKISVDIEISRMQKRLENMVMPPAPGAMPEEGPEPEKGTPPEKKDYREYLSEKGENYFTAIKCALSPELKQRIEDHQIKMEKLEKLSKSFGSYPQDKSKESSPLRWKILDIQDEKALLITESVLEEKRFYKYSITKEDYEPLGTKSWERCDIREWLNGEFLEKAFNTEEKKLIFRTGLYPEKNPKYDSNRGRATNDNIFVLSISEAQQYFESDKDRIAKYTPHGDRTGYHAKEYDGCAKWWLRTTGKKSDFAALVERDGSIDIAGDMVDCSLIGVRPALWVNLNELRNYNIV